MASLRARLLVAVLALTACGLLLVGGITYIEQRSFQYSRVDQELKSVMIPVSGALEAMAGGAPWRGGDSGDQGPGPGGGPNFGIPAGTYGQKRDANGRVIAEKVFSVDETVTAKPALPAKLGIGQISSVRGEKGVDTRYRVVATQDPRDGTITVVALPLRATDETLRQLLVVEALVIAAVLIVLGLVSWVVVRVGLLPLDRMGHTAGAIAGGDLSHRVESTDPRSEVGRLGIALNAMLDRLERA
ncbi:MAG TPA: HAMP domain-containing protein, partial [Solirubrobacteraceae bacterium]|nr:HAMP domain-containing protein [Solirubrobacteraceae bacterium]